MNNEEAISRLSTALALLGAHQFDKEAIRSLVKDVVDEKHSHYIERGLLSNDRTLIMHGIVGALSHYEAEKEKEKFEKNFQTLTDDT
ncbi:MAG: hypothetical protein QW165_03210 [Candidatus Woesearchaeota archaeon]